MPSNNRWSLRCAVHCAVIAFFCRHIAVYASRSAITINNCYIIIGSSAAAET